MNQSASTDGTHYEFLLSGDLTERAVAACPELHRGSSARGQTRLFGAVAGPTALRAILARFDTLGLTLLEMRRLPN